MEIFKLIIVKIFKYLKKYNKSDKIILFIFWFFKVNLRLNRIKICLENILF